MHAHGWRSSQLPAGGAENGPSSPSSSRFVMRLGRLRPPRPRPGHPQSVFGSAPRACPSISEPSRRAGPSTSPPQSSASRGISSAALLHGGHEQCPRHGHAARQRPLAHPALAAARSAAHVTLCDNALSVSAPHGRVTTDTPGALPTTLSHTLDPRTGQPTAPLLHAATIAPGRRGVPMPGQPRCWCWASVPPDVSRGASPRPPHRCDGRGMSPLRTWRGRWPQSAARTHPRPEHPRGHALLSPSPLRSTPCQSSTAASSWSSPPALSPPSRSSPAFAAAASLMPQPAQRRRHRPGRQGRATHRRSCRRWSRVKVVAVCDSDPSRVQSGVGRASRSRRPTPRTPN